MPVSPHRLALCGAALTLFASSVRAQTVPDPEPVLVVGQQAKPALTTPGVTASRLGLTPLETPASVTAIDGDVIRAVGDMSIVEAVSRAPGVTSVANVGNGGAALAARGFSGQGSVLQLVEGVRLFPAAGTITFPADPWMVQQIDVLTGPASVLYGQGALGGAVNVIMRKPNTQHTQAQGEIGYGSQNTFHAAAGLGGPIDGRLSYRVDASYRRSDGYVDRGRSDSVAFSATLRWAVSERFTLTLREDYGVQHPMRYTGTPLIDGRIERPIIGRNYNVADAAIRYRDNRTTVQADWTPSDTISITSQTYRLTSRRFWRDLESYCWVGADGNCPNGYNASLSTPGRIYRTDNLGIGHNQTQWGDTGSVTAKSTLLPGITNALVGGFDANTIGLTYANDFGSDVQEDSVNPYSFNPGLFYDTQGIAPRYRTRTDEFAIFAEDRMTFGEHLSVLGGIRYEQDRIRRWTIDGGRGAPESFVLDKTLRNTTWRVGWVYQPLPPVSLYAQYVTGVDPLGTLTTYTTGQVQFSNATGDQVEVGAKGSFLNGRGTATVAAYRIVKKHLLAQQTLTSPIEQVGQRSAEGIEASLSVNLAHAWGIEANGTVMRARFDTFISGSSDYTGKVPPNIPQQSANLWLRWAPLRQVQARGGLRYVGQTFSDNANLFRIPAYATVDGALSWAITPRLAADVHFYNVFNKVYATTAYNDQQWILGRPRSVDASLRAAF